MINEKDTPRFPRVLERSCWNSQLRDSPSHGDVPLVSYDSRSELQGQTKRFPVTVLRVCRGTVPRKGVEGAVVLKDKRATVWCRGGDVLIEKVALRAEGRSHEKFTGGSLRDDLKVLTRGIVGDVLRVGRIEKVRGVVRDDFAKFLGQEVSRTAFMAALRVLASSNRCQRIIARASAWMTLVTLSPEL